MRRARPGASVGGRYAAGAMASAAGQGGGKPSFGPADVGVMKPPRGRRGLAMRTAMRGFKRGGKA